VTLGLGSSAEQEPAAARHTGPCHGPTRSARPLGVSANCRRWCRTVSDNPATPPGSRATAARSSSARCEWAVLGSAGPGCRRVIDDLPALSIVCLNAVHGAGEASGVARLPGGVPRQPSLATRHGSYRLAALRLPGCQSGSRRAHRGHLRRTRLLRGLAEAKARALQAAEDPGPPPARALVLSGQDGRRKAGTGGAAALLDGIWRALSVRQTLRLVTIAGKVRRLAARSGAGAEDGAYGRR